MNDVGFPIGAIIVIAGALCFAGVHDSQHHLRAAQAKAYGLGLLGAFLAFGALLIAVAIS